ncbi:MAG: insulinase family protein [Myxococcales bacterium]|nr:insulinase family protein [Myxococcales bacterium]MBL9107697.1 insulinase family protein [Myxococcales bacterium]
MKRLPPIPYETFVLPNGLRTVVVPQPTLHRAHVGVYVRVGSRFETPETNGLSHFLEHMLYRGTSRLRSANAVNHAFESLGGYLYAATHSDFGVFSVTLPEESLEAASALFAEVLTDPGFFDIDIEKGIVAEEILEDLDDEGRQVDADNLCRELLFPNHPLGYTITGDEPRVRSFDERMLRAHHTRHYTAENCVLVLSGKVTAEAARKLAEAHFTGIPRGPRIVAEPFTGTQKKPRIKLVENVTSQTELRLSLRAFSEASPERPTIDMLMRILDDGMSTRVYHRICDSQGLCYDVGAAFDGYEDQGVIDFSAGTQHSRTTKVAREMLDLVRELAASGPTEAELDKARKRNAWDIEAMLDSPEDLGSFYGGGYLFERFETVEERLEKNAAVTREAIRDLVAELAKPARLNVLAVGMLEDGEGKKLSELVKSYR